jgi:uncharacterized membrane protein
MILLFGLAVFLDGLMAGVVLGSALVEQSARSLPAEGWIRYKQAKERVFGPVMPFLLAAAVAASSVAAFGSTRAAFCIATLLLLLLLAVTVVVHIPLNQAIEAFPPSVPPTDWIGARDRWRSWNWARATAAVAAFGAAVLGALL